MVSERIVSMLFSDLKGYSKIKNDEIKTKLVSFTRTDILNQLLNSSNHIYHNTWGDAFFICSDNPVVLAEIALQIRDKIKNKDWMKFGLNEVIAVRIALHAQTAQVIVEPDGTVSNVVGKGVDKAARIEPVTEPNEVFCSDVFHQLLLNESVQNIRGIAIGRRALAKNFGEMNLFRLVWASETPQKPLAVAVLKTPSIPLIKRKPTDLERNDFLYQAFSEILSYLRTALDQLSTSYPEVKGSLRVITDTKFICEIYLHGQLKNSCKIWIGRDMFPTNSINYSEGRFGLDNDNSFNESLQVEDGGSEMFLKPLMSMGYSYASNKMSPEQAAEYLWKRLTNTLER
jgi:class 3 adenylate cyclase